MHTEIQGDTRKPLSVNAAIVDGVRLEENISSPSGHYKVIRRNGKITRFDASKITVALTKAFLAVEGGHAASDNFQVI